VNLGRGVRPFAVGKALSFRGIAGSVGLTGLAVDLKTFENMEDLLDGKQYVGHWFWAVGKKYYFSLREGKV
jgi:hypothetical protein